MFQVEIPIDIDDNNLPRVVIVDENGNERKQTIYKGEHVTIECYPDRISPLTYLRYRIEYKTERLTYPIRKLIYNVKYKKYHKKYIK